MQCLRRSTSGFTLLEVLVALVLLTLFAFAAYRGLNAVLEAEARSRSELARWQTLARVFARIEADLQNAVPVPPAAGKQAAAFMTERSAYGETAFAFSRLAREEGVSGLDQVRYHFAARQLIRSESPVSRSGSEVLPVRLLDGLEQLGFRYMDAAGNWQSDWRVATELPLAVEVAMAWPDGVKLRRVFRTQ